MVFAVLSAFTSRGISDLPRGGGVLACFLVKASPTRRRPGALSFSLMHLPERNQTRRGPRGISATETAIGGGD